ncbi:MAG: DUF63 family protein [Halobacteriaceae archaeon]
MVLPSGTEVPPLPYLAAVAVAAAAVGYALWSRRPDVSADHVVALAPWMVAGAFGYVAYQAELVPAAVAPLASSPTVYVSTGVVAGALWAAADAADADADVPRVLAGGGGLVAVFLAAAALGAAARRGSLSLAWPLGSVVLAVVVGGAAWALVRRLAPAVAGATGRVGALVVFGHALDGVSTAVGYDVLSFGERTPLSRLVIEFGASLPTASVVGAGWLFVAVKVALAAVVVALVADLAREEPRRGYLLLGLLAAVGLGPGAHNVLLFAMAG